MTNNTAQSVLSEAAQKEANLFQQSRRASGTPGVTSAYVSRIHSLVFILGFVILVLGGTLVYLVYRPPVTQVVLPAAAPAAVSTEDTATAASVVMLVANASINEGTAIGPEHLGTKEIEQALLPAGVFTTKDVSELMGQYAVTPILAGAPITRDAISKTPARGVPFDIPPGHRATTITIDRRAGVEGFAKPGTFVDVLWYYQEKDGRQRVKTIVPRAKVLSVGGATENEPGQENPVGSTATILVTQKQAHSIELARNLGVLSLSLVGAQDDTLGSAADLEVTVNDILHPNAGEGAPVDGVVISVNPITGRQQKFVLKERGWVDGNTEEGYDLVRAQSRRRVARRVGAQ